MYVIQLYLPNGTDRPTSLHFETMTASTIKQQLTVRQISQRIINVWNSLSSDTVDFGTLRSFKRTIKLVDFSQLLKCF